MQVKKLFIGTFLLIFAVNGGLLLSKERVSFPIIISTVSALGDIGDERAIPYLEELYKKANKLSEENRIELKKEIIVAYRKITGVTLEEAIEHFEKLNIKKKKSKKEKKLSKKTKRKKIRKYSKRSRKRKKSFYSLLYKKTKRYYKGADKERILAFFSKLKRWLGKRVSKKRFCKSIYLVKKKSGYRRLDFYLYMKDRGFLYDEAMALYLVHSKVCRNRKR